MKAGGETRFFWKGAAITWEYESGLMTQVQTKKARPFLKWAGGKRQLLSQIDSYLPPALMEGALQRYVEPFVGSGAVFFHIVQNYPVQELFIADINPELILAYRTIQKDVEALIDELACIEDQYLPLAEPQRKAFYYRQRELYNEDKRAIEYDTLQEAWFRRTAQLIFLNRTCYNGLFRVNSHGEYNVPFGRYKNPTICDGPNLRAVSELMQQTMIHYGHYSDCAAFVDESTLVYFDPPYRPISATANFTAYSPLSFDDDQQLELADFYRLLDDQGAALILSNSDPKNTDPDDDFLEDAYAEFRIERVQARRRINRSVEKRGPINELLILNY
jgi:DNA adenine methylase